MVCVIGCVVGWTETKQVPERIKRNRGASCIAFRPMKVDNVRVCGEGCRVICYIRSRMRHDADSTIVACQGLRLSWSWSLAWMIVVWDECCKWCCSMEMRLVQHSQSNVFRRLEEQANDYGLTVFLILLWTVCQWVGHGDLWLRLAVCIDRDRSHVLVCC